MKYNRLTKQIQNETKKAMTTAKEYAKSKPAEERTTYLKNSERFRKSYERAQLKRLAELEALEDSHVDQIRITTEWKKSRTWGLNPHTLIAVWDDNGFSQYTGKASGCGYDKYSTAVANALNQCADIIKLMCDRKERKIEKVRDFNANLDNRRVFGYGAGYGVIPQFEGGVGIQSTLTVLQSIGFKVVADYSGKNEDYILLKREGGKL